MFQEQGSQKRGPHLYRVTSGTGLRRGERASRQGLAEECGNLGKPSSTALQTQEAGLDRCSPKLPICASGLCKGPCVASAMAGRSPQAALCCR